MAFFGPTQIWNWLVKSTCELQSVLCTSTLADVLGLIWGKRLSGMCWHIIPVTPTLVGLWSILFLLTHLNYMCWPTDLILEISRNYAKSEISKVGIPKLFQSKGRHDWMWEIKATCLSKLSCAPGSMPQLLGYHILFAHGNASHSALWSLRPTWVTHIRVWEYGPCICPAAFLFLQNSPVRNLCLCISLLPHQRSVTYGLWAKPSLPPAFI